MFQKKVEFLGRWIGPQGLEVTTPNIQAVADWPVPTSTKDVERFLGLVNYHRSFIKDYARIAIPLYQLTGKQPFHWDGDQEEAFSALKKALTSAPVLGLPNRADDFVLDTDASNYAIGAQLSQMQDGVERVVAYGSFALTKNKNDTVQQERSYWL